MKKDMEQETHKNISEQVLAKIQKERIIPRSKWRFLFHDYLVWTVSIFSLTIGSLSFGLFLTILLNNDWGVYEQLKESRVMYNLSIIPYLWLFFVIAFIFYADYFFKNTEKGYRYRQAGVVIGSIAVSAILGTAMYFTGLAQNTDDYFVAKVPCYHKIAGHRAGIWELPDKGLLAGTVGSSTPDGFILTDFSGKSWVIVGGSVFPQEGVVLKIVGIIIEDGIFKASEVRPWYGKVVSPEVCGMIKCTKGSC